MMQTLSNVVIHQDIEPGVIDNAMLTKCVLNQGPKGEAGRLFEEEGIHLEEVTALRLEFEHILRIDHLWMMTSLTKLSLNHNLIEKICNLDSLTNLVELDLSFNVIEKIENLEKLINIEVLSLFHNKIKKLENLDNQEKILIFSIGDNLIADFKQAVYLRRFKTLRTVSFKGNPCCNDPMCYIFLKIGLHQVIYLDYKKILAQERQADSGIFRTYFRNLTEEEDVFEKERLAKEQYNKKVQFFATSFVEYLSGPELFEAMFEKDADGLIFLKIGGELGALYDQDLIENNGDRGVKNNLKYSAISYHLYKEQYVAVMDELVAEAQTQYALRESEISKYRNVIEAALDTSIEMSKEFIKNYKIKKEPLVKSLEMIVSQVAADAMSLEDSEIVVFELVENFNGLLFDLWKKLMSEEMNYFERTEETRVQFGVNIDDLVSKLLERSRYAFGVWRELESNWTIRQSEELMNYLGLRMLPGNYSHQLTTLLSDRDIMMNAVAQSTDSHVRFINTREDLLLSRVNEWKTNLIEKTTSDEIKRNRSRILEINYFVDNERQDWADIQRNLVEMPDAEAAAIFGEDI